MSTWTILPFCNRQHEAGCGKVVEIKMRGSGLRRNKRPRARLQAFVKSAQVLSAIR